MFYHALWISDGTVHRECAYVHLWCLFVWPAANNSICYAISIWDLVGHWRDDCKVFYLWRHVFTMPKYQWTLFKRVHFWLSFAKQEYFHVLYIIIHDIIMMTAYDAWYGFTMSKCQWTLLSEWLFCQTREFSCLVYYHPWCNDDNCFWRMISSLMIACSLISYIYG